MSSVSSIGDLSDAPENSEEDDADDEEDPPVISAPSFGKNKGHKAVPSKTVSKEGPSPTKKSKKNGKNKKKTMRISDDDGYDDDNESEDSSDDVYAAVDYISDGDGEGEEQEMEKLEEMMILESENERVQRTKGERSEWEGFGEGKNSVVCRKSTWRPATQRTVKVVLQ